MKVFVLALGAALGVASAASADCLDVATKAVQEKGFTVPADGAVLEEMAQPANSNTTADRAWVRVTSCKTGHIVVNMQPATCAITKVWTQGDCDVPEVRQALSGGN
jgi:hypothetical protein